MACYSPIRAYQCADGSVVFAERGDIVRTLELGCQQCIGCRLERSRQWAVRCVHESKLYENNCFVTLTYDDDHVSSSLCYRDFQLFIKRVRRRFASVRVRFYMSGEYGEALGRPHFHAILFNLDFADKKFWRMSPAGFRMYRSKVLESLWTFGHSEIGSVTFESAAYIARYCVAKRTGHESWRHYVDVETGEVRVPEFNRMSLKPGIGAGFMSRWSSDVAPDGRIVVNGVEVRLPKYYEKFLSDDRLEEVLLARHKASTVTAADRSDERLAVREKIARARAKLLKRTI